MALLHPLKQPVRSIGGWDLVEKLADSGMGTVYKAQNRANGATAAVKVLPPFNMGNAQAFQRFARECRILSAVHDPHIVRAIDFGIEGAEPYLVMEWVEGETLRARVERTGGIPEEEAVRLIAEAAGALGRAHARGLVHRNVTPDSILIRSDGHATLTDMCLIKEMDADGGVTRDGTSLGTPNFMSPEQIRNAAKANRSCDIYSLAATLYLAVTGQPPFGGCHLLEMLQQKLSKGPIPPQKLLPTLSARLDRAIRRAMSPQPIHRPETCEEFVDNLTGSAEFEVLGDTRPQADAAPAQPVPVPLARAAPQTETTASPEAVDEDAHDSAWSWVGSLAAPVSRLWRWLTSPQAAPAVIPTPRTQSGAASSADRSRRVCVRKVRGSHFVRDDS